MYVRASDFRRMETISRRKNAQNVRKWKRNINKTKTPSIKSESKHRISPAVSVSINRNFEIRLKRLKWLWNRSTFEFFRSSAHH